MSHTVATTAGCTLPLGQASRDHVHAHIEHPIASLTTGRGRGAQGHVPWSHTPSLALTYRKLGDPGAAERPG
jgi:hypothetical protein